MSQNPLVTFEEAEREHLRQGVNATPLETLQWLESASEFADFARGLSFKEGAPVIGLDGSLVWSEEEYWGYPQKAGGADS